MKQFLFSLTILCFLAACQKKTIPPKVAPGYVSKVEKFIELMKKNKPSQVAAQTKFPFPRTTPIKDIANEKEFVDNYDLIFDENIIQEIIYSDPKGDWGQVGSKGIMFKHGSVWLTVEGLLLGVNHEPEAMKEKLNQIVSSTQDGMHESVAKFKKPIIHIETKQYQIRVDELDDGDYRYACWQMSSSMSDKPDLVLYDGTYEFQGSGGDVNYIFNNLGYKYVIATNRLGPNDSPDAYLWVYNGEQQIVDQGASIIKK